MLKKTLAGKEKVIKELTDESYRKKGHSRGVSFSNHQVLQIRKNNPETASTTTGRKTSPSDNCTKRSPS